MTLKFCFIFFWTTCTMINVMKKMEVTSVEKVKVYIVLKSVDNRKFFHDIL